MSDETKIISTKLDSGLTIQVSTDTEFNAEGGAGANSSVLGFGAYGGGNVNTAFVGSGVTVASYGGIVSAIDLVRLKRHFFPKPSPGSCVGYVRIDDVQQLLKDLGVAFVDTTPEPTAMELVRYQPVINISDDVMPAYAIGSEWVISRDTLRESLVKQGCRTVEYSEPPEPDANCVTTPDGGCTSEKPCMHSAEADEGASNTSYSLDP